LKTSILKVARRIALISLMLALATTVLVLGSHSIIKNQTQQAIFQTTENLPANKTALVLGTSPWSRTGQPNLYFKYRMEAAEKLWKSGKINYLVLSGDNKRHEYNEPLEMKKALMSRGIPDSVLYLDYAGFRTFDSVIRMKAIFGQTNFTIISQQFHVERALFIASKNGLNSVGFASREVPNKYSVRTQIREYGARFKTMLDIYLLNTKPRFLGDPVIVGEKQ
jgi:SanA protein